VNIGPSFTRAFQLLKERSYLALTPIIMSVLIIACIIAVAHYSGVQDVAQEYTAHNEAFNAANPQAPAEGGFFAQLIAQETAKQAREKAFDDYLTAQGFDVRIVSILTINNLILGLIAVALIVAILWIGSTLIGVLAAQAVRGESWDSAGRHALHKLFPYLAFRILGFLIFAIPLAILFGLVVLVMNFTLIIGIMLLIIAIPLAIAYCIFFVGRLVFAEAFFFVDGTGPVASLRESYQRTKGNFGYAFLVILITWGISIATSTFVQDSVNEAVLLTIMTPLSVTVAVALVVALLFIIVGGAIRVFQSLFLFTAKEKLVEEKHE
jgi:hypothetical protein